jgi:LysR family nitrogen assimilation transcriptional regulator
VILGLPPVLARILTVPLFKSFRKVLPNGSFGVVEGLSASVVEWLVEGRVDIGLVYNPAPLPSIEITPLHEEEMYLISSKGALRRRPGASVPLKDLARYPLIIPSRPNANRMRIEGQLAYLGLKPRIEFEIEGVASVLDLVHEGYGHTVLPLTSLRSHVGARDFAINPIRKPKLTIQVSLITSAQRPITPLAKGFLSLIREVATDTLAHARS